MEEQLLFFVKITAGKKVIQNTLNEWKSIM